MFWGEHLITVFTVHNIVEPLDTFSKFLGPIFTVDINCREVIFKVTFTIFNSLPITILTTFTSRIYNVFLELSRGKGKWCWLGWYILGRF